MDYDTVKEKIRRACSDSGEAVILGELNGNEADLGAVVWKVPVKLKFFSSNSAWEISPGNGNLVVALDRGRNVAECSVYNADANAVKTWTCDISAIEGICATYELRGSRTTKPLAKLAGK